MVGEVQNDPASRHRAGGRPFKTRLEKIHKGVLKAAL
jgi:hypothetical protein